MTVDIIKLKKNLASFNYLFFVVIVLINLISYLVLKNFDVVLIILSLLFSFLSTIPYFRDFSVDNFKLTYFLQGLGLAILIFWISLKIPLFIFAMILVSVYIIILALYSNTFVYNIVLFLLISCSFLLFSFIGEAFNLKELKKLYKISSFYGNYLYFVGFNLTLLILGIIFVNKTRSFILDYYKSQLMEVVSKKISEANRIAQEKAKEAEEKHRESVIMKEKQEKVFELNVNLAKKIKNIKSQLQYVASEIKNMLYASGVVILVDKGVLITADYYVDVPLPVVESLKVSPRTNENVKKFINASLKNKEVIHINKRKEIIPPGFNREDCYIFLQEISKVTYEVFEVLLVPIVNSFGESMGLFVIFNNTYDCFSEVDKKLAELIGIQAGIILHNSLLIKKLEDTFYETINAFSSAIEAKDKYTPVLHTYRVGELAYKVALEMGLSEEEAEKIKIAGILHDIGKLAIPDSILAKQGPLTDQEREVIKTHSEEGSKILSKISFFREKGIHIYVLYHHERVDGKGYPKGLRGREIPLGANIISVADTYDAISTPRPYNKHYASEQKAIEIIKSERGRQFFEEVVDAFFRVLEKEKMKKKTAS